MLGDLGARLGPDDEAVYRLAMTGPGISPEGGAAVLGRSADEVRGSIDRLAEGGLLVPAGDGALWAATPPEVALGPVVARSRERLRRDENVFAELVEAYHAERSATSLEGLVELVEGEAQAARVTQLEIGARESFCAFQTGANTVVPVAATLDPEWTPPGLGPDTQRPPAIRGDLAYRLVVDAYYLQEPGALRKLDDWLAAGQEIRVSDEALPKVLVADGSVAMAKVAPDAAVVLRGPLAGLAQALFEATWRGARPYLPGGAEIPAEDAQLLQLMLAGLTDVAMAKQLGTSQRTVQRRLRALMDSAHVTTRVQLGWYALRHRWV
ncbi:hypothetical protein [Isoptericola sp. NPDC055881]